MRAVYSSLVNICLVVDPTYKMQDKMRVLVRKSDKDTIVGKLTWVVVALVLCSTLPSGSVGLVCSALNGDVPDKHHINV